MANLFHRAPSRQSIRRVFQSLERKAYDMAQNRMVSGLPGAAETLHDYALWALREFGRDGRASSMTGNTENGYGIAIYRNGKCIAVATTHDVTGRDPIQMTLTSGEVFRRGRMRYDNTKQYKTFADTYGERHIFAHQEVVNWLNRYPPRVRKGRGISTLAYRVVCIVDYARFVGGRQAMLRFADDCERGGAKLQEFKIT